MFGSTYACTSQQTSVTSLPFPWLVLCFHFVMEERELLEVSAWAGALAGRTPGAVAGPQVADTGIGTRGQDPLLQQDRDAHPPSVCSPLKGGLMHLWLCIDMKTTSIMHVTDLVWHH